MAASGVEIILALMLFGGLGFMGGYLKGVEENPQLARIEVLRQMSLESDQATIKLINQLEKICREN